MLEYIRLGLKSILSHLGRSVLTMSGISIGIAALMIVSSIINGTNARIKEQIIGAGTNTVRVKLCQDGWEYEGGHLEELLTVSEPVRQPLLNVKHVESVSLYNQRHYADVYYRSASFTGSVLGIDDRYFGACGYALCYGRLFLPEDTSEHRKLVILDRAACRTLFAEEPPVGKILEIQGEPFTVIGVVDKEDSTGFKISSINDYYMYTSAETGMIFISDAAWPIVFGFDEPKNVVLRADSTDVMTSVGQKAEDILSPLVVRSDETFSYESEDLLEQAAQMQTLSNESNRLLLWVGAISLLVGGFGIMNNMLVTVTERTREIGLKKAIGARKRSILCQFLAEAVTLSLCGALLGVVLGCVISFLLPYFTDIEASVDIVSTVKYVLVSIGIGLVFGTSPAARGSKMNPIDALRN